MSEITTTENKYDISKAERQKHVDAVLSSQSKKNIVVAGPGTGKTHLFKQVLKGKTKTLTLTFVNPLVEDLSLELCGISDVRTLHGFARSALGTATSGTVKVFPKLSEIIKEDAKILLNKDIDFDHIFHNRDDENKHIEFYKKRKNYYDKHYGYSDIIFAIVKHFESKKDKIPSYEQVVVDEFQDFNKLEVSLIDLLAEKSPILLAGDDDQALYAFKSASPEHIRQRHAVENTDYASFTLPYCSRCTRVIVEATNDIIQGATKNGNLTGRINKDYKYFDDEKKDKDCDKHPKIGYGQLYAKQIPWFIEQRIGEIAEQEKGNFSVLIISPTKVQIRSIVTALKNKGFGNIQFVEKKDSKGATLLDGLKILLSDSKSNLGWRIVSKSLLSETDFKALITTTDSDSTKVISEIISKDQKKEVDEMLKVLRAVKDDKRIDENKLDAFLKKIDVEPYVMAKEFLKDEISSSSPKGGNAAVRKIPIKATTIQSSKGLSDEYVFITNFDDQYFIKNKDKKKITDQDICNLLVALTRAKKKVFLISSNTKKEPTFLKWINEDRIEKIS
jgi:superfamily I DNA/RNA helicase